MVKFGLTISSLALIKKAGSTQSENIGFYGQCCLKIAKFYFDCFSVEVPVSGHAYI